MAGAIGDSIKRKEDPRLLRGEGVYAEDIQMPGMLWVHFVRSIHAHARILDIDATEALAQPGVTAVLTGKDIHPRFETYPVIAIPGLPEVTAEKSLPPFNMIATDKVRHVGEIVAIIVAEERYIARDVEDLVRIDYEVLSGSFDPEEALRPDAPQVHDDRSNEAMLWRRSTPNVAQAFEEADVIVRERFVNQRIHGVPMEPRAGVAHWDPKLQSLSIWASTQTPHDLKDHSADILGLKKDQVRVVAPDVGGGFGPKAHGDPEYVLMAAASLLLNAPTKWVATRSEEFLGMSHARGKVSYLELAANSQGKVTGLRLRHIADLGAYPKGPEANLSAGSAISSVGSYGIPEVDLQVQAVYTHRTPETPYRGAGRPEGMFLIERGMDMLAQELKMDPAELRRRNYIPAKEFPYRTPGGDVYDSGDYAEAMETALRVADYPELRKEQARLREEGRYLGIGFASWIKSGGIGPSSINPASSAHDWGRVSIDRAGKISVYTGSSPHGQGLETTFAQVVSAVLPVDVEDIEIVHGDTGLVTYGMGTYASRSMVIGGTAIHNASEKVLAKMRAIAAFRLGVEPGDIVLEDGKFAAPGPGKAGLTLAEVAASAYRVTERPADMEFGLDESCFYQPKNLTYSYGTYVAVVEVDGESGGVEVRTLYCVDDQGVVVNPLVVEGQIHGGAAQGLGQALYEQIVYDDTGQLATGTLMDYCLPTAEMVPPFVNETIETPSPTNPLGVKGMGEGPTVGTPPAVVNAVVDALAPFGVRHIEMPLTSEKVWRAIQSGRNASR